MVISKKIHFPSVDLPRLGLPAVSTKPNTETRNYALPGTNIGEAEWVQKEDDHRTVTSMEENAAKLQSSMVLKHLKYKDDL